MKANLFSLFFFFLLFSFDLEVSACGGGGSGLYTPSTSHSMTGAASYCLGATSRLMTFTYNTAIHPGTTRSGVSVTVHWYRNTTNSTMGGTAVTTTTVTCATAATGSVGYLPPTASAGTFYYYCVLTWTTTSAGRTTTNTLVSTTAQVIVKDTPHAISGTLAICTGATTVLTNATSGGTWSSSNVAIASIVSSSGSMHGIAAGTARITYANGCGTPATVAVTINATPGSISGSSSVCGGATITLSNSVAGGVWSASGSVLTVGSATGTVTGVSMGTSIVSYSTGCGTAATKIVSVNTLPAISGVASLSVGYSTTFSDAVSGGTWSCSNTSIATIASGSGVLHALSAGLVTVSYTRGSCPAIAAVSVCGTPAAISGAASVCVGQTITLSDATTGGAWSSSDTGKAAVDPATGVVTGIAGGTCVISYASGCGVPATSNITVIATPSISGASAVCPGATVTLSACTSGGTWTCGTPAVATISSTGVSCALSGLSAGTAIVSYAIGSCVSTSSVNISALPDAGSISGSGVVCVGNVSALSGSVPGGIWSCSDNTIADIDSTGLVTGVAPGVATISFSVTNVCGTSYATYNMTVNALPNADTIGGASLVCVGRTVTLADSAIGGIWQSSDATIATIDSAGLLSGVASGTAVISYSVTNGCGSDYTVDTIIVTSDAPPILGSTTVCNEGVATLSDSTTGGTWSSSNIDILAVSETTGKIYGESAGTAIITYALTAGCTSTATVVVLPAMPHITGITTICSGYSQLLSDSTGGGSWASSNTSVATISSAGYVYAVSPGTSVVTYSTGAGCSASVAVQVISSTLPITGTGAICSGMQLALCDPGGGVWSSSRATVASVDAASGVVTGVAGGTSTISYSLACGIATATVTVNPGGGVPSISSVSTLTAIPQTTVTISGANFSANTTDNTVYFGATQATVLSATPSSLHVSVPTGATYSPLTVNIAKCGLTARSPQQFLPSFDNSACVSDTVHFNSQVQFVTGVHPVSIAIADIDGDGMPDIAAVNTTSNTVSVLRNTSSSGSITCGSFADKVDFATGTQPFSIAIADLDGDGKPDIVIANDISNSVSVFLNTATPGSIDSTSFAAKVDFATGVNPVGVAIADVNGDGKPDIVTSNYYSNTVSVLRNTSAKGGINCNSFATKTDFTTGNHPYSATLADLNGDGKPEIIVANSADSSVSVFPNTTGPGSTVNFGPRINLAAGCMPYSIAVADFDGDGKQDIAVVNSMSRTVSVIRNIHTGPAFGSASFASKVDFATGIMPMSISVGDINGDGKPDMVITNYGSSSGAGTSVSIIRNTISGSGITSASFAAKVDIAVDEQPRAVAVADLDGDYVSDLAIACASSNSVYVMRNSPLLTSGGSERHMVTTTNNPAMEHATADCMDVKVIPNPNNGHFRLAGTVALKGANNSAEVEVTDMLGRVVYSNRVQVVNNMIDEELSLGESVANGMYILTLRSANKGKSYHVMIGE